MRKGFVLSLLAIVVVCSLLYGIFIALPRPHDEEVIRQAVVAGEKAFAASQVDATDPAKNGWLNPTFLPYWGRKDKEQKPDAPIRKVMTDWVEFSAPGAAAPVDHSKLLADKDPKYMAAASEFEKVAPELLKAMQAPRFVAPESRLSFSTMVMNYIAVRSSSLAVAGLSQRLLAQKKPAQAAEALLAPIIMSAHMRSQAAVISDAVAVAVGAIAIEAFECQISPRTALPAALWKKAAETFTAAIPSKDQLLVATQIEVAAAQNTFKEASEGKSTVPELDALRRLPGMLAREQRIYNNIMSDLLQDLQQNRPPAVEGLEELEATDYLMGRVGPATVDLVPGLQTFPQRLEENRRQLIGLATVSGVAAYLAEKKALPKDHEQVRAVAKIPDPATFTDVGLVYKLQGEQATVTIPQMENLTITVKDELNYGPHPWFKLDEKALTWTI